MDLAITTDLGTLQRLPIIKGYDNAMELALTAPHFSGWEARRLWLVSQVFGDRAAMDKGVAQVDEGIGGRLPLALIGTKRVLIESRDMALQQGLDYVATWNSKLLLSYDLKEAFSTHIHKREPLFAKL